MSVRFRNLPLIIWLMTGAPSSSPRQFTTQAKFGPSSVIVYGSKFRVRSTTLIDLVSVAMATSVVLYQE